MRVSRGGEPVVAHHTHDAEPDYIIYHFSELPTAVEFLAAS